MYEKIKGDLNIGRDRLLEVSLSESGNLASWVEATSKIGELVLNCCSSQIFQYSEEARKIDQQRLVPGWNFLQFFLQKEAIALTFEMLGLYQDALYQYDELEIAFFQTLEEQGAPWFRKFGATGVNDDIPNVFSGDDQKTRASMVDSTITIFDFRMYLFHRQCMLLDNMRYPLEILKRTLVFTPIFARTLSDYQQSLKYCFQESWIFGMVTHIVRHCNELSAISEKLENHTQTYEMVKGDLYFLARYQLDRLGVATELLSHSLHCNYEFMPNGAESEVEPDLTASGGKRLEISNPDLLGYLSSKSNFDDAYQVI